jgi:hypothetical protein
LETDGQRRAVPACERRTDANADIDRLERNVELGGRPADLTLRPDLAGKEEVVRREPVM